MAQDPELQELLREIHALLKLLAATTDVDVFSASLWQESHRHARSWSLSAHRHEDSRDADDQADRN